MTWRFCPGCRDKGPVPECPLCRKENGRGMTGEEAEALLLALREEWKRSFRGDVLSVPFEDGTTPRRRRSRHDA